MYTLYAILNVNTILFIVDVERTFFPEHNFLFLSITLPLFLFPSFIHRQTETDTVHTQSSETPQIMVVKLDVNSKTGSHVRRNICYLIC